jgi:multidrug efflux pump subunit AcrB
MVLVACAFIVNGLVSGFVSIVIGLALGVVGSALFLPMLGNTLALGHHGGEGDKSVAAFNRRYGHWIAFAVGGIAALCLYSVLTFQI